jgi:hypothetical protein
MNTSVKLKAKFWPTFIKACESQWKCGGQRYALTEDKEFTDLICEAVGEDWIGGNIMKYTGEIINAKKAGEKPQEVNFFKIAVYAFIWWLKHMDIGFTQRDKGEEFEITGGKND